MTTREKIRSRIAQEAARLMVEEGIEGYHRAKLKAIERLSLPAAKRWLPPDETVDDARREYLRLFEWSSRSKELDDRRGLALDVMNKLERFSPRLVGGVADGTAGRHSPIIIHVFPDTPEEVITRLIDLRIPYREGHHVARLGKSCPQTLPAVTLHHPRSTIDILFFPYTCLGKIAPTKKGSSDHATCRDLRRMLDLN